MNRVRSPSVNGRLGSAADLDAFEDVLWYTIFFGEVGEAGEVAERELRVG